MDDKSKGFLAGLGIAAIVPFIVIGILAVMCVVCCLITFAISGNSDGYDTSNDSSNESPNTNGNKVAKIGEQVRDGKFEFTVNSVECGLTEIKSEYSSQKANGEFCIVDLKVKNIGNEAQVFSNTNQYLIDNENNQYEADSIAGIYYEDGKHLSYENINPGIQVSGVIIFDVSDGENISKLILHDSYFSDGVTVSVK